MKDLIIDALAAFAVSVVGFFQNIVVRKRKNTAGEGEKTLFLSSLDKMNQK